MQKTLTKMSANSKYFDTIVIGAGISGLACAARLFQHRARAGSVLVLEARDRIGGRIGSVYVNGHRLDTGANWVHGIGTEDNPNPLMNILPHKRYRQLSSMVAFRPSDEDDSIKLRSNVKNDESDEWEDVSRYVVPKSPTTFEDLVIPSDSTGIIQGAMWGTIESIHEIAANTSPAEAKRTSILAALKKSDVFRHAFKELPSTYHRALSGMLQFMEPMEAGPLAAQSAEHEQDNPGMGLLEFAIEDFEGDQLFLQDGYMAIVNEIAKDLFEAGVIKTSTEVEQIDWQCNPISIKTTSGTYTAKDVICTLPLGVLKQREHKSESAYTSTPILFQPALPQEKKQAISSLGFGTLDKIFLIYSKPWWTQEPYRSIFKRGIWKRPFSNDANVTEKSHTFQEPDSFAGFTNELPGIEIDQDGNVSTGPRLISMANLHSLSGFPVLCAFVSCANAVQIERLSNADASALIQRTLTSWLGREPPNPQAVHVTRWASDHYAFGSYTHMITGLSETRHRDAFQRAVTNDKGATLRFAGEHTSLSHFATVHGALLSGWREADEILKNG